MNKPWAEMTQQQQYLEAAWWANATYDQTEAVEHAIFTDRRGGTAIFLVTSIIFWFAVEKKVYVKNMYGTAFSPRIFG